MLSSRELLDWMESQGVLGADKVSSLRGDTSVNLSTSDAMVRDLFDRGWLTEYQANSVAQGRMNSLILGQYNILDRIGVGGMGEVFAARHRLMNRKVAIKVIHPHLLRRPDAASRFRREIQAISRLAHPNIVMAYDASQVGDVLFFAMEFVQGIDLANWLRTQGRLPIAQACGFLCQALIGLQHAHEQGLVHRDLKPANLLVTDDHATVKILDFGLAKLRLEMESPTDPVTSLVSIMGTPDYLAPEQSVDAHSADIRSDIYSLGCSLYHLLAGRVPFSGKTAVEKILKHRDIDPIPLPAIRPEVPRALADVVRIMMAKNPSDRFQFPIEATASLAAFAVSSNSPPTQWPTRGLELLGADTERMEPTPRAVPIPPTQQTASQRLHSQWQRALGLGAVFSVVALLVWLAKPLILVEPTTNREVSNEKSVGRPDASLVERTPDLDWNRGLDLVHESDFRFQPDNFQSFDTHRIGVKDGRYRFEVLAGASKGLCPFTEMRLNFDSFVADLRARKHDCEMTLVIRPVDEGPWRWQHRWVVRKDRTWFLRRERVTKVNDKWGPPTFEDFIPEGSPNLVPVLNGEWGNYRIRTMGHRIEIWVDQKLFTAFTDPNPPDEKRQSGSPCLAYGLISDGSSALLEIDQVRIWRSAPDRDSKQADPSTSHQ